MDRITEFTNEFFNNYRGGRSDSSPFEYKISFFIVYILIMYFILQKIVEYKKLKAYKALLLTSSLFLLMLVLSYFIFLV